MAGRRRTPTAIRKLRGNPGNHPINENEPKFPVPSKTPRPPKYFDPVAKARWNYEVPILMQAGVITAADQGTLEMRCLTYSQIQQLRSILDKEGRIIDVFIKDKNESVYLASQKSHPASSQIIQLMKEFRQLGSLLGLDPRSRAGIEILEDLEEDEMEKFLKRNNGKKG